MMSPRGKGLNPQGRKLDASRQPRPVPRMPRPARSPKDSLPLEISSQTSKIEFVGSKVTGRHNGGFKTFEGIWNVVPGKLRPASINAEIAMDSVWADNDKLTGHTQVSRLLRRCQVPHVHVCIDRDQDRQQRRQAPRMLTHTVTGNLTLHGVTKSIEFPARIVVTTNVASLDSEFFLNRKDFGVNYPGSWPTT